MMPELSGIKIGYALCGSFCTFKKSFEQIKVLIESGAEVTPIMSFNAYNIDTRFGTAEENRKIISELCGREIIHTIEGAEPIGPQKMFDILTVAPCTGNTLAKLAVGIIDTPVTMAVKSHIRNMRPVVIAIATNDALSGSAKNIGMLYNYKNYYFVPMSQDDPEKKPTSVVADYGRIKESIIYALDGKQIQPILI
ncbi:MAG TPA: dipicolinate synthase subunit B [Oscillospiraceae bacterium]|nr:dipicolinate synthase subunit B [Oscillospiraceae bacterium]